MMSHLISHGNEEKELEERRRVHARIVELKASCQNLAQHRDQLQSRLEGLNKTVDQLLVERDTKSFPTNFNQHYPEQKQQPTSKGQSVTSGALFKSTTTKQRPSEIFKLRLACGLNDMQPKAEEIASISDIIIRKRASSFK